MKAILNEKMFQSNLSKTLRMIYENLTINSLIIYSILFCIIPIIYFASKKLNKSKDILDSDKDIQERHISKKNIQDPSKETKDKKENKSKSKILRKMIYFCICKKKKKKDPNQLQLGILLKEEDRFQIKEENKEEQILYNISQNNKISSKKGNNNVKNITKDNIIQDNNIIRIIETDIISQNKENNKKDIINNEEKEKIKNYFSENKNEDDINKRINENKEIKDNKKNQEGKVLKLIKGKGQNNIENKKMNKPKENGLNDSINIYFQNSQFKEKNLNNPKLQIQKQYTFEFKKQNINSRNIEKGNNKIFENIKYEIEEIKLQNHKMNYEIAEIKYESQILMIKFLDSEINEKINSEKFILMENQIVSNIYKMSYIFRILNNIRLILKSRKYINQIIKYEVDNNKNLKISKSLFLNDIAGFKYKDDENKIKLYINKFIVQIVDHILSQNQYNLTIDFLFFLKKFFNDSVHFVNITKDITINKRFNSIFYSENKNYNEKDNKIIFNKGDNNSINISNIQCENKNKNSDKIFKNIENLNEINNSKIFQQYKALNSLDTQVSNYIQEAHDE